jgi:hypothetical protein
MIKQVSTFRYSNLLLGLTFLLFLPQPPADSVLAHFIRGFLMLFVLTASAFAVVPFRKGLMGLSLMFVGAFGLVSYMIYAWSEVQIFFLLGNVTLLLYFTVVCWVLMMSVLRVQIVSSDTILGSMSVYLLIGLTFAFIYSLAEHFFPGSFLIAGSDSLLTQSPQSSTSQGFSSYVFFSFITLTTVGYGDIIPVHEVVRNLAVIEAVIGQFFLAVIVARLVASQLKEGKVSRTSLEK